MFPSKNSAFYQPQQNPIPLSNSFPNLYDNNNPNDSSLLSSFFGNNVVANNLISTGLGVVGKEAENMRQRIDSDRVRYYFTVNNFSVFTKMKNIIFPFLKREWTRARISLSSNIGPEGVDNQIYQPPRDDPNSPDLYLPLVFFITFIILVGVIAGLKNAFKPDVLVMMATFCFSLFIFELFLACGVLYCLSRAPRYEPVVPRARSGWFSSLLVIPFLQMVSYLGYKYFVLSLCYVVFIIMSLFPNLKPIYKYLVVVYLSIALFWYTYNIIITELSSIYSSSSSSFRSYPSSPPDFLYPNNNVGNVISEYGGGGGEMGGIYSSNQNNNVMGGRNMYNTYGRGGDGGELRHTNGDLYGSLVVAALQVVLVIFISFFSLKKAIPK